ncbi:MAG: Ig-like domain-containing protein, partial [Cyanobacteriota bacterium]
MAITRSALATANPLLAAALVSVEAKLLSFAQGERFSSLINEVYGAGGAPAAALRQRLLSRGNLDLRLVSLSSTAMNGALGGYSPTGEGNAPTIYLNADLLSGAAGSAALERVLLEEIGHHFDRLLNGDRDTAGDEGQLFASRVLGDVLSASQLAAIRSENDLGVVQVGGRQVIVENATTAITATNGTSANGTYSIANSTFNYTVAVNGTANNGADFLVAAYASTSTTPAATDLIGWQVVNRSTSYTASGTYNGTFDFADAGITFPDNKAITLRVWQGTAGTGYGTASDSTPKVTYGNSNIGNGIQFGFRPNVTTAPTATTGAVTFTGATAAAITTGFVKADFPSVFVDTKAPAAPTLDAIAGNNVVNLSESSNLQIKGTAEANSVVTVTGPSNYSATATASGSGAWSITVADAKTTFGEGSKTITVIAKDAAGNSSPSTTRTISVDTIPPVVPSFALVSDTGTSNSDGITSNGTVRVSNLETGATWQYTIDGGTTWTNGSGTGANALFVLAQGTYDDGQVLVRQTDAAGNSTVSTSFGSPITVDSVLPTTPTINTIGTDNYVNASENINLVISGTAEAGSRVSLTSSSGYNATAKTGTNGIWSITVDDATASFGQGNETIIVSARDTAGNVKISTSRTFTVDTVGPVAPSFALVSDTGVSNRDKITNNGSIKVSGLEHGAKWEYTLNGNVQAPTWLLGSGSTFTLAESSYSAGSIKVRQSDAAGNTTTSVGSSPAITVDASAPDAPTITAISGDNFINAAENTSGVTISGTAEAGAQISITGSSGYKVATTANGSGAWSVSVANAKTSFGEGEETITVFTRDAAGNVSTSSSRSFSVDTTGPVAPTFALLSDTGVSNSDKITNNGTIKVSKLEAGASWQYSTDGGSTWEDGSGSTFTLAEGNYSAGSIKVRQSDAAGNTTTSVGSSPAITVDASAPDAPKITAIATDNFINAAENTSGVTISGTAEAGAQISITGSSGYKATATANGSGAWSVSVANAKTSFGEGEETITVFTRDAAGNVSTSSSRTFTVDTTGPVAPTFALLSDTGVSNSDKITNNGTIKVSGLEPGAKWEYTLNGNVQSPIWLLGSGSTFTLAEGTHNANTIKVRQSDAAGNTTESTSNTAAIIVDASAPVFTSNGIATAISENSGANQVVYNATADNDSGVTYSLANSGDASL